MNRPPNLAITLITAVVAFFLIIAVRDLVAPAPKPTTWLTDKEEAFARARALNKPLLIDYQATWSGPSMEMSESLETLRPHLAGAFVPLRVDVSNEPFLPAGLAFLDGNGTVLARLSYGDTDEIRRVAERVIRNRRR